MGWPLKRSGPLQIRPRREDVRRCGTGRPRAESYASCASVRRIPDRRAVSDRTQSGLPRHRRESGDPTLKDGVVGSSGAEWWRPAAWIGPARAKTAAAPAKDSPLPFAALLLFLVLLLLAPQAFVPGVGRVRLALFTGAFAIVAHCWTRFAAGRAVMRRTREMWLVAALLAWAIVTLPLSVWPGGACHEDFWPVSLPSMWATSASRSPGAGF